MPAYFGFTPVGMTKAPPECTALTGRGATNTVAGAVPMRPHIEYRAGEPTSPGATTGADIESVLLSSRAAVAESAAVSKHAVCSEGAQPNADVTRCMPFGTGNCDSDASCEPEYVADDGELVEW